MAFRGGSPPGGSKSAITLHQQANNLAYVRFLRRRISKSSASAVSPSARSTSRTPRVTLAYSAPDSVSWQCMALHQHADRWHQRPASASPAPTGTGRCVGTINFRQDLLGRLRHAGQFISGTTYGSRADADWRHKGPTIHLRSRAPPQMATPTPQVTRAADLGACRRSAHSFRRTCVTATPS